MVLVQQSAPFLCFFVSPASRGIIQPSLWIENGVLTSERTVWILPRCLNLNSAGIQSTERAVLMPRCHSDPTKASTESGVHCVVNAFNCYFQALLTLYIHITEKIMWMKSTIQIEINSDDIHTWHFLSRVAFFWGVWRVLQGAGSYGGYGARFKYDKDTDCGPCVQWLVLQTVHRISQSVFTNTKKAPTPTSAFTFKTLLIHYAKGALTPQEVDVKLGHQSNYHFNFKSMSTCHRVNICLVS